MPRPRPPSRRRLLKSLAGGLAEERGVRFAYAYGSLLRRKDPRDIDVAVYLDARSDPWTEAQRIASRLEKRIRHFLPVDVHALNQACACFAFQVLSTGKPLVESRRGERLGWEAHAMSRYQDIKPMLDFYDRKFLALSRSKLRGRG